jgi:type I restriction enzyme S subunit
MVKQAGGVGGVNNKQHNNNLDLPEGWEMSTLGEFVAKRSKGIVPNKTPDETFELYSVPSFDTGTPEIVKGGDIGSNKQIVREGAVLLCKINPRINRSWIVSSHSLNQKIASTEWIIFPSNDAFEPKYLAYYLKQDALRDFLTSNASGVGGSLMRVKPATVKDYPLPIAPENEQKCIVAEIEKQFSRLAEAVDNLKRVKANLKRYKASVLKAAVEGKLTEEWRKKHTDVEPADKLLERILAERRIKWEEAELAKMKAKGKVPKDDKWKKKYREPTNPDFAGLPSLPSSWAWTSVDYLGEVVTGTTPSTKKKEYYGGNIPFFKPTELDQGYYLSAAATYLTKAGAEKARLIPSHSVMVTCIGATIGKIGLSRVHGTTNQQINTLIPDSRYMSSQYLYFAFISPFFFKQIVDNSSSTTLPIINKSKFTALPIMVPPLEEQIIIVDEIECRLSLADKVGAIANVTLRRAERLRQSILKKAFSGQLIRVRSKRTATICSISAKEVLLEFQTLLRLHAF